MDVQISNVASLPTEKGDFLIQSFKQNNQDHLVIFTKDLDKSNTNVRIHSECLTGDAIGSIKCDCQAQLNFALSYIQQNKGMVIYLRQEGRGIGLFNKVNAYNLQDKGYDTIEANHKLGFHTDERNYEIVDYILEYYGLSSINLLTNNPEKINNIKTIIEKRIPIVVGKTPQNENYIQTKKDKMGHLL